MKIRIIQKNNKKHVYSLDLSKIVMLEGDVEIIKGVSASGTPTRKRTPVLNVFISGELTPFQFSSAYYIFEQVEVSGTGAVRYYKRSIPEIVALFDGV